MKALIAMLICLPLAIFISIKAFPFILLFVFFNGVVFGAGAMLLPSIAVTAVVLILIVMPAMILASEERRGLILPYLVLAIYIVVSSVTTYVKMENAQYKKTVAQQQASAEEPLLGTWKNIGAGPDQLIDVNADHTFRTSSDTDPAHRWTWSIYISSEGIAENLHAELSNPVPLNTYQDIFLSDLSFQGNEMHAISCSLSDRKQYKGCVFMRVK